MAVVKTILSVIYVILGIILAIVVLMQEGKSQGLGALGGMADSYWGKNKGRSMEGALERFTKIGAALFMVLTLVLNVLMKQQGL